MGYLYRLRKGANLSLTASLSQFSRRAFCASSRASSLASAYRRAPYQRLRQTLLAASVASASSLNQRLVRQPLSGRTLHKAIKPRESMILHVTLIKPESKFVDVPPKMLRTSMVIDADQAALENRENALNSIGGHVVSNIFASSMVDNVMAEARIANARICTSFVGMQGRSNFDVL